MSFLKLQQLYYYDCLNASPYSCLQFPLNFIFKLKQSQTIVSEKYIILIIFRFKIDKISSERFTYSECITVNYWEGRDF